jgi:hypothetical protein
MSYRVVGVIRGRIEFQVEGEGGGELSTDNTEYTEGGRGGEEF